MRGSVLPGQEVFSNVLIPGQVLSIKVDVVGINPVTRIAIPDFTKTISIFVTSQAINIPVAMAIDSTPVATAVFPGTTTEFFISDMSLGVLLPSVIGSIDKYLCLDIHDKKVKELRLKTSQNVFANATVTVSFY